MFDLGTQELIVIFLVAFLVFGPRRLPELGRALGKGIRELKAAMRGVRETIEEAGEDVTGEVKSLKTDMEDALYKGFESTLKDRLEEESGEADDEPDTAAADDESEKGDEHEGRRDKGGNG